MHKQLKSKTTEVERTTAESALEYMSTEEGERDILNPEGYTPILKCTNYTEKQFIREFNSRISMYVSKVIQDDTFVKKNLEIYRMTNSCYREICKDLEDNKRTKDFFHGENSDAVTKTDWYALSDPIPFLPFLILLDFFNLLGTIESKERLVHGMYDVCKIQVHKRLQNKSCHMLKKIIEKVMGEKLPRRLDAFRERTRQLLDEHLEITARHELFNTLLKQIKSMNDRVIELQDCLNLNAFSKQDS